MWNCIELIFFNEFCLKDDWKKKHQNNAEIDFRIIFFLDVWWITDKFYWNKSINYSLLIFNIIKSNKVQLNEFIYWTSEGVEYPKTSKKVSICKTSNIGVVTIKGVAKNTNK